MSDQPFAPRRILLLVASFAIALALVVGVMAAPAASPAAEDAPALSAAKLAASCSGQNNTYGALTYGNTVQRDITISCAPSQARVTRVDVTVNLDHDCSKDLNIRLDRSPKSTFLQTHDTCPGGSGPQVLTFTSYNYNSTLANGVWKLFVTDWCRPCDGFLNFWSITVHYAMPTATPSNTPTPTPSHTPEGPPPTRVTDTPTPSPTPTTRPEEVKVTFPEGDWPWYAQDEISVHPEPPVVGQLTTICADIVNQDPTSAHTATIEFKVAEFGIGVPFTTVGWATVHVPPGGMAQGCAVWTPPVPGHWCIEVVLTQEGREPQRSQRNIDADEPLEAGVPHARQIPIGNPFDHPVTITLGMIPHLPDWGLELSPDTLPNMQPCEIREITLTVSPPPDQPLPPDGQPIVDVEAYVEGELIGGFRKVYRPEIPIHRPKDPIYAESEITVHPYPVRAGEPTEICVELRNPTDDPAEVMVVFSWADLGIGIPFMPINGPRLVLLPPHSMVKECLHWIPPVSGNVCVQVELYIEGQPPFWSQRNIDADEPLEPGIPHSRYLPIGNPFEHPVTVTLGLIPHLPDWGFELSPDILPNMQPGEIREVTLMVIPPPGQPLPPDGEPIVDVEAFVDGELIGGFRKVFRPPVAIHRPKDPVYAESEIGVDPYPIIPGQPVQLSVELSNASDQDQVVWAFFRVALFGIGLPFSDVGIESNPVAIFVPAHGAARGHATWYPGEATGQFCARVIIEGEGFEPIWSSLNLDVGEPLRPGESHALEFPVSTWPHTEPVTVTLGLTNYKAGWEASLSEDVLANLQPGEAVTVSLNITVPFGAELGTGDPIVDVEAYVAGELLGGFRKLDVPPVSIHKRHEKSYAESEITIDPEPPQLGQESRVSVTLHNTGDVEAAVILEFGWAQFGMGIPFTTTGMVPSVIPVAIPPHAATTTDIGWTPTRGGHQCVLVRLLDPEGQIEPQQSQHNVDVTDIPPCDITQVFTFTIYNDSSYTATVDIGMITFDVPADWQVTVDPGGSMEIGPNSEITIMVTVLIPCPPTGAAAQARQQARLLREGAGGVPIIDVEGYIDGDLVGGIEIRFAGEEPSSTLLLPLIFRP